MMKEYPQLYEYLSTRKFTNKTNKPYAFEPLDERHEEFNKRGVNLQLLRTKLFEDISEWKFTVLEQQRTELSN